jgi:hypothetical protein
MIRRHRHFTKKHCYFMKSKSRTYIVKIKDVLWKYVVGEIINFSLSIAR